MKVVVVKQLQEEPFKAGGFPTEGQMIYKAGYCNNECGRIKIIS